MTTLGTAVNDALNQFVTDIVDAVPKLFAGIAFLLLAAVVLKVVVTVLRAAFQRTFPDQPIYVSFGTTIATVVLWFAALLTLLAILGLEGIAASLGTASGFLALGVAYAVSGMIADAVAGVYLLRDPDFNPGDRIEVGDTTGVVRAIELRKSRIEVEGGVEVRGNADIEKRWRRKD